MDEKIKAKKNRYWNLNYIESHHTKHRIVDGFQIPVTKGMLRLTGTYLEKNAFGYFKTRYLSLMNQELYFYNDYE